MNRIDLHVHSACSDGTLSPSDLVYHAKECQLTAFALTDHDNTDGIPEAQKTADDLGIELIPGIEFSTDYQGTDIHIVGLDIDWTNPDFQQTISFYRSGRTRRNQKMIDLMAADGIDISYEQMSAAFGNTVWTRANFARYLLSKGYISQISEAFQTYIGDDCKYYVSREKASPMEVVRLIRTYHGIPILAHPFQYHFSDKQLRELLDQLIAEGLLGMEVYYSTHSPEQTKYLKKLAAERNLLPSGGSDFHGSNKPDISLGSGKGNLKIPYELLNNLRAKLKEAETHEIS